MANRHKQQTHNIFFCMMYFFVFVTNGLHNVKNLQCMMFNRMLWLRVITKLTKLLKRGVRGKHKCGKNRLWVARYFELKIFLCLIFRKKRKLTIHRWEDEVVRIQSWNKSSALFTFWLYNFRIYLFFHLLPLFSSNSIHCDQLRLFEFLTIVYCNLVLHKKADMKMAWSRRFIPKLFVWHSSGDIVRMKWRYYRTGLYTEKRRRDLIG